MKRRPQFISFPKSGRTWVRYMLNTLGVDDAIDFQHDGFEFNDGAKPILDFDLNTRLKKYGKRDKVVYLERDPRDVMVSFFHQITGRFRDYFAYEGDLSAFVRDDYFGAHNLAAFQRMWREIVAQRDFLLVEYERVHEDTAGILRAIVDYYGLTVEDDRIEQTVEQGRIDNMRKVETSDAFPQPWLRTRNGHPKVRSGIVGGDADALSPEDIAYLNRVFDID